MQPRLVPRMRPRRRQRRMHGMLTKKQDSIRAGNAERQANKRRRDNEQKRKAAAKGWARILPPYAASPPLPPKFCSVQFKTVTTTNVILTLLTPLCTAAVTAKRCTPCWKKALQAPWRGCQGVTAKTTSAISQSSATTASFSGGTPCHAWKRLQRWHPSEKWHVQWQAANVCPPSKVHPLQLQTLCLASVHARGAAWPARFKPFPRLRRSLRGCLPCGDDENPNRNGQQGVERSAVQSGTCDAATGRRHPW